MTNNMPAIPVITDPKLILAVRSLGGAALSFKEAFLILVNIAEKNDDIIDFLERQASHLSMCESVVDHWSKQLDIESEM